MGKTSQLRRLKHLIPRRHGRWPIRQPITPPLFNDLGPAVSDDDIALWIATYAPRISPMRRSRYALDYRIADKVARDKAAGRWPPKP